MSSREQFSLVVVGHVDHGKSTVIGRLLADTGSLPEGKLEAVRAECARNAKPFEYAFLLDALKAEQAQGITIDTARSFFKGANRDYILIDAPGHIEFLKNMITGAARAEAAVLVIDAKEGVRENSRRHGYMLSMLGIKQVIVAVNKMDLAGYSQTVFDKIVAEFTEFLAQVGLRPQAFVPIAAFHGVNLTQPSPAELGWYQGPSLLGQIDRFAKEPPAVDQPLRLPVQDVYKFTEEGDDRRIVAGRVETGTVKAGDRVTFWPSGKRAVVKTLEEFNRPTPASFGPGKSVGLTLDPEIYVKPGEILVREDQPRPKVGTRLRVNIFWMGRQPFVAGRKYKLKLAAAQTPVWLEEIVSVLDASNLGTETRDQVEQYEVGQCVLETYKPLAYDLTADLAATGRFVIVDGYEIAGGGIILEDLGSEKRILARHLADREARWVRSPVAQAECKARHGHDATVVVLTGPETADLTGLGVALEARLLAQGRFAYFLGLKNALLGLQADQEASPGTGALDRSETVRRLGETAHLFADAGAVFVTSVPDLDHDELQVLQALARPAGVLTVAVPGPGTGTESPDLPPATLDLAPGLTPATAAEDVLRLLASKAILPEYDL
jgi:bifunctional enzyme CysN/CysC